MLLQLRLLLWKCFNTSRRSLVWTSFELLLPFCSIFLILLCKSVYQEADDMRMKRAEIPEPIYEPVSINRYNASAYMDYIITGLDGDDVVSMMTLTAKYVCNEDQCDEVESFMNNFCRRHGCIPQKIKKDGLKKAFYDDIMVDFTSIDSLKLRLSTEFLKSELVSKKGAAFDFDLRGAAIRPEFIKYYPITNELVQQRIDPVGQEYPSIAFEKSNFALLFDLNNHLTNKTMNMHYRLLRAPESYFQRDKQPGALALRWVIVILCLGPLIICVNLAREIASERESNIQAFLFVMGMTRGVYLAHHIIYSVIKVLPTTIAIGVFFAITGQFGGYFYVAYLLYSISLVAMSTMIASIFKSVNAASMATLMFCIIGNVLAHFMPVSRNKIALAIATSIHPGYALSHVIDSLIEACLKGQSVNIFAESSYVVTYGTALVIMIADTVLFISLGLLISWYKSTDGIWAKIKLMIRSNKHISEKDSEKLLKNEDDAISSQRPVDIEMINVQKKWPGGPRAVRGVNLKVHRGQVTALLGHNGAGKSTTFAMLSGMTKPSSGEIRFGEGASVGFCPQYNPLFPMLTVDEHIFFYAMLKGADNDWWEESEELLKLLNLDEKRNMITSKLSGGMKRKLCVIMALIGNRRVILLDEPTAGMDTGARRDIETLLVDQQKKERTFLLTTHYTDEAERLGDNVAIMAHGKVVARGTPQYLNQQFGAGYILSCVVTYPTSLSDTANKTLEFVKTTISEAKIERQHGEQFEIFMPRDQHPKFPELFKRLEDALASLDLQSFGLQLNTLEQVFLKVGEMTGETNRDEEVKSTLDSLIVRNGERLSGVPLFFQRLRFMLLKRILYEIKHWKSFLLNAALLIIGCIVAKGLSDLMIGNSLISDPYDFMHFDQCPRLGIDKSIGKFNKFKKAAAKSDPCLELVEVSDIDKWYAEEAFKRPLVAGVISRSTVKNHTRWILNVAQNQRRTLPAMSALIHRVLKHNLPDVHAIAEQYSYASELKKTSSKTNNTAFSQTIFLIYVSMFIFYRFIGFHVEDIACKFAHLQLLTGVPRWLYWLGAFLGDAVVFSVLISVFALSIFMCGMLEDDLGSFVGHLYMIFVCNILFFYLLQRFFNQRGRAEIAALFLLIPRTKEHKWSSVWTSAEAISTELNAVDVCLSQASLEDAFISAVAGST